MNTPYPVGYLEIVKYVPGYVRRMIIVGAGYSEDILAQLFHKRGVVEVVGIEWRIGRTFVTPKGLDAVVQVSFSDPPFPLNERDFDAVVIPDVSLLEGALPSLLQHIRPYVSLSGCFVVVARGSVDEALETSGLVRYHQALVSESEQKDESVYLVQGVHSTYAPREHAWTLMEAGQARAAFEVLNAIPESMQQDPYRAAQISADAMEALLRVDEQAGGLNRLNRFGLALLHFQRAVGMCPEYSSPYYHMAAFWTRMGHPDMASRLRRSAQHILPDDPLWAAFSESEEAASVSGEEEHFQTMEMVPQSLRVLYLMPSSLDYGLDVLYGGLCGVLGEGQVVDFPFRPWLHGQAPPIPTHYPCIQNHPGQPLAMEELENHLKEGAFDVILFGDLHFSLSAEVLQRIRQSAGHLPVFGVDQTDLPTDYHKQMIDFWGESGISGYFKREMLLGADYAENTWPLPFAYPDGQIPSLIPGEARSRDLFWAGNRNVGARRLYLDALEHPMGRSFNALMDQEAYARTLRDTRIGLDFFGSGFDTVRYWELPAHGCMLLAERRPIRIPDNFRDGESAVFFGDLPSLQERLAYYLAHPDAVSTIAAAGYQQLVKYHTATARARQALAHILPRLTPK